jgi:hypothetical protein
LRRFHQHAAYQRAVELRGMRLVDSGQRATIAFSLRLRRALDARSSRWRIELPALVMSSAQAPPSKTVDRDRANVRCREAAGCTREFPVITRSQPNIDASLRGAERSRRS